MALFRAKISPGGTICTWQTYRGLNGWAPAREPPGAYLDINLDSFALQAHHASDVILGLKRLFRDKVFQFPKNSCICHAYWQSPKHESTLTYANITQGGKRALAEKSEHRHRFILVRRDRLMSLQSRKVNVLEDFIDGYDIPGCQLAERFDTYKGKYTKSGGVGRDATEELGGAILGSISNVLHLFH